MFGVHKMIRIEHNAENNSITEIELTPAEVEQFEEMYKESAEKSDISEAEAKAKAQAKASAEAKLEALGLTADDLKDLGL
jgi:hypothetical protein